MTKPQASEIACLRLLNHLRITPAEAKVLSGIADGKRNHEIASVLGISRRTVEKHVERILAKFDVETRTAAASRFLELQQD